MYKLLHYRHCCVVSDMFFFFLVYVELTFRRSSLDFYIYSHSYLKLLRACLCCNFEPSMVQLRDTTGPMLSEVWQK